MCSQLYVPAYIVTPDRLLWLVSIRRHNPRAKLLPRLSPVFQPLLDLLSRQAAVLKTPFGELSPSMQIHGGIANHDLVEFVRHVRPARKVRKIQVDNRRGPNLLEERRIVRVDSARDARRQNLRERMLLDILT